MNDVTKLNWVKKSKNYHRMGQDVAIKVVNYTKSRNAIQFTFHDESYKMFTDNEYMTFAVFKNRIFFKKADEKEGYKLTIGEREKASTTTRYCKCTQAEFVAQVTVFEGAYDIKYDEFYDLYYIENKEMNTDECRN